MSPYYFTRRTIFFFVILLVFLCAFSAFEVWQQRATPGTENFGAESLPEINSLPQEAEAVFQQQEPDTELQKCHLALSGESLCVYAGPISGGGELLQKLNIPLSSIPPRWLAQLTNGGIEFANEESLLMALDNLDELIEENREVVALPHL